MKRTILLKYGEIILKGANRRAFEKQLADSIRRRLKGLIGEYELEYMQSTVYVTPERDEDVEIAHDALSRIFGIVSLCIAYRAEKSMEEIMRATANIKYPSRETLVKEVPKWLYQREKLLRQDVIRDVQTGSSAFPVS